MYYVVCSDVLIHRQISTRNYRGLATSQRNPNYGTFIVQVYKDYLSIYTLANCILIGTKQPRRNYIPESDKK